MCLTRRQREILFDIVSNSCFTYPCHGHLAFAFSGSKLVSVCPNICMQKKYHHETSTKYTVHAEIHLLLTLKRLKVKPNRIKVISIGIRDGKVRNGIPCNLCHNQLLSLGYHKIVYSDLNAEFKPLKSSYQS